jgi:hypothetical protein
MPVLPRMVKMIVRIIASRVMADPTIPVRMHMRRRGVIGRLTSPKRQPRVRACRRWPYTGSWPTADTRAKALRDNSKAALNPTRVFIIVATARVGTFNSLHTLARTRQRAIDPSPT